MSKHPVEENLIAFAEGRLERLQRRTVVAHLLHGCPACSQVIQQALRKAQSLSGPAYDSAFAAALLPVETPVATLSMSACLAATRRSRRDGQWRPGSLFLQPVCGSTN